MRKILSTIVLASATAVLTGCGFMQTKDSKNGEAEAEVSIETEEEQEYLDLKITPLPCAKESLYIAWREIGAKEPSRGKVLDYKQHTPTLFIPTDLDGDGETEVLLRGESPYAAIFTVLKDTIQLITYIENPKIGLSLTADGTIVRSGSGRNESFVTQFIKLKDSKIAIRGEARESFTTQDNQMILAGSEYKLGNDSTMATVTKEQYQKVAPKHNGTYLEDFDGWEDFRKP